jgi:hypothetical protein
MHKRSRTNLQAGFRAVRFLALRARILCAAALSADTFAFASSHCILEANRMIVWGSLDALSKWFGWGDEIQVMVECGGGGDSSDNALGAVRNGRKELCFATGGNNSSLAPEAR